MKRLFSIEWNKVFYNKGTRIFIIIYFIMIILMGAILPNIKPQMNGAKIDFIELGALDFPIIWHNISWLVGFGKFFLAIIVINNITNEYSFGTFKQNTIDGLTKTEFFGSKILLNLIITVFSTIIVAAIVIGLGASISEKFDLVNGIEFLAGYFVEIFTYIVFAMFLSFLFKKSAFSILSIIVFSIGESILKGVEYFIRFNNNPGKPEEKITLFTNYLPLNSNSEIIGYPSMSIQKFLMGEKLFTADHVKWEFLGTNVFYIILFLGLTLLIIKKRDL